MSAADGNDTRPGWPHRRSSRPEAGDSDLPEPLMPPLQTHVSELHRDFRALRSELLNRQDAERKAIYNVHEKVVQLEHNTTRTDAKVDGLRTVVDEALRKQRRQQQIQLWVSILATVMISATFILILLRSYRLVGV